MKTNINPGWLVVGAFLGVLGTVPLMNVSGRAATAFVADLWGGAWVVLLVTFALLALPVLGVRALRGWLQKRRAQNNGGQSRSFIVENAGETGRRRKRYIL